MKARFRFGVKETNATFKRKCPIFNKSDNKEFFVSVFGRKLFFIAFLDTQTFLAKSNIVYISYIWSQSSEILPMKYQYPLNIVFKLEIFAMKCHNSKNRFKLEIYLGNVTIANNVNAILAT